jgi:hypothetical protein
MFSLVMSATDFQLRVPATDLRSLTGALVSSALSSLVEAAAISSTATMKAASFALDGMLYPLILRTNCSEAAFNSTCETGGSILKRV